MGGVNINEDIIIDKSIHRSINSRSSVLKIAPIYLASCIKQGMGLLEILLRKQPVQNNQVLLKIIEICRLYELDSVSSNIMKVSITMNSASKEKTQGRIS
ncbi:hypothetical protein ACB092_08G042200 [Castanea dentata]